MVTNTERQPARALHQSELLAHFGVAGVIIIGGSRDHDRDIARLLGPIPAVVAGRRASGGRFPAVTIDHAAGADLAIEHLIALGHRRIGMVGGDAASEAASERRRGYLAALRRHSLPIDPALLAGTHFDLAAGRAATGALLARADPPTAIFYQSDELAFGGLRAIRAAGRRVPVDLSVVSFNDIPFAEAAAPPLTTVQMPAREMGMLAMQLLLDRIAGREPSNDVVLGVSLVVRESTDRPGARAVPAAG
jgi:DNA-binding LacI/PurR family transcriptional regulator